MFGGFWRRLVGMRDELRRAWPTRSPQRKRLPRAHGQIEFPMGPDRFRRDAVPYTLGMFQRVQDHCAQLDATSHAAVDAWLNEQDAGQALQLEIGVRLRRTGLHVMVEH